MGRLFKVRYNMKYVMISNDGDILSISDYPKASNFDREIVAVDDNFSLKNMKYDKKEKKWIEAFDKKKNDILIELDRQYRYRINNSFFSEVLNERIECENLIEYYFELEFIVNGMINKSLKNYSINNKLFSKDQIVSFKVELEECIFGLIDKKNKLIQNVYRCKTVNELNNIVWV